MSRTKKNKTPQSQNNSNSNYQEDDAKKAERRRKNNAVCKRNMLSTPDQISTKARKRDQRRRRAQSRMQQPNFIDNVEEDLRLVRKNSTLCLMGRCIENLALKMASGVPEIALMQRRLTEGYPHYITIATRKEAPRRMRADRRVRVLNNIVVTSPPFVNLGLGMVQNEENDFRSWHCVISWPAGQKIRNAFGLPPRNLYLTLGYHLKDLDVPKGPSTLIHYSSPAVMTSQQIKSLIFAALIESYTSKGGSLLSLMLASAQAKLIGNEYLISAAKHSLNRVQRGERLEEFEEKCNGESMEVLKEKCTEGNCIELAGFMQHNISNMTAELESLAMAQPVGDDFPFNEVSDSKTSSVKEVISKLESLNVDPLWDTQTF
ncbi:hypothetical protein INT43_008987 [Umbelopsis isabellina]|uniref:Swiss Army Knife 2H phosphoesterase domain-containing protein n=1 Tax=Mortierella isabellina TaxID=91625 RepID=A0A8H7UJM6_MORIS|nr:hypothetical protein INT43_008987 [Umbelopsis isabellina]